METKVTVNETDYYINTNPKNNLFATIYRIEYEKATDPVALAFSEASGMIIKVATKIIVDEKEMYRVVCELGKNFSKSKAWQRRYQLACSHMKQNN